VRLSPGTIAGPYVIRDHLASGGMGEVYRARDPRLERDVAVKVLATSEKVGSGGLVRFEREARATAALNHTHILTVFDVGTHEGRPFLVTELLEGETLRSQLDSGPLAPPAAVRLALQLARGVAAAHALRIVHRDLKPENVFITREGMLKILDFGLAKLRTAFPKGSQAATLDASTPGQLLGTLAYMAPEQARGGLVDERTDIFAIGVLLHEMVRGRVHSGVAAGRRRSRPSSTSRRLCSTRAAPAARPASHASSCDAWRRTPENASRRRPTSCSPSRRSNASRAGRRAPPRRRRTAKPPARSRCSRSRT
jgi:serine/threonine protein kinase